MLQLTPAERRAAAVLLALLALGIMGAGFRAWRLWRWRRLPVLAAEDRPDGALPNVSGGTSTSTNGSAEPDQAGTSSPAAPEPGAPVNRIVVHVTGAVNHPGVVELPEGARVWQAVEAAGGSSADGEPQALNLAARLADGDRLYVPTKEEVAKKAHPNPAATAWPGPAQVGVDGTTLVGETARLGKVNLNRASQAELETLPGIGPALAQRILRYRQERGRFGSIEELQNVAGIGPSKFADIKDLVELD